MGCKKLAILQQIYVYQVGIFGLSVLCLLLRRKQANSAFAALVGMYGIKRCVLTVGGFDPSVSSFSLRRKQADSAFAVW